MGKQPVVKGNSLLTAREISLSMELSALKGQSVDVVWGIGSRQIKQTTTGRVLDVRETIQRKYTETIKSSDGTIAIEEKFVDVPKDGYVILDGVKPTKAPVCDCAFMQSKCRVSVTQVRIPFSMIERYSQ